MSAIARADAALQPPLANAPPLPRLSETEFAQLDPTIRDQIRTAIADATRRPTEAALGRAGMTLAAYEQYDRAATFYARARALAPREFRWTYYLALAEAAAGRAAEAIGHLREALQLDGRYLPARLKLAELLLASGETADSHAIYRDAARDAPSSALAQYGLGRTLFELGDVAAAAESQRRACELSPHFGAAHYALAVAYRSLGRMEESEAQLSLYGADRTRRPPADDPLLDAIEAEKRGPYHYLELGRRLNAAGKHREAVAAFSTALELAPELAQAHVNLITAYAALGDPRNAEDHFRRAVELNPHLAEAHYNLGVLMIAQDRPPEAVAAFRRAIDINPLYADAHNNLGYLLAREHKPEEAMRHLRAALDSSPDHRDAHFNLAQTLQALARHQEAIEHFRRAATVDDDKRPTLLYYLADAYARTGATDEAIRYATEARARAAALGQTALAQRIEAELANLKSRDQSR